MIRDTLYSFERLIMWHLMIATLVRCCGWSDA